MLQQFGHLSISLGYSKGLVVGGWSERKRSRESLKFTSWTYSVANRRALKWLFSISLGKEEGWGGRATVEEAERRAEQRDGAEGKWGGANESTRARWLVDSMEWKLWMTSFAPPPAVYFFLPQPGFYSSRPVFISPARFLFLLSGFYSSGPVFFSTITEALNTEA